MWFFIARSNLSIWIKKKKRVHKTYRHGVKVIEKFSRKNIFLLLFLAKIIYGAGTVILIYLSRERLTFKKFILYNSGVLLISISLISYLGWLAGRGLSRVVDIFDNVRLFVLFLVIFAVVFHIVRIYFNKWLEKK